MNKLFLESRYDRESDVLYISAREEAATKGVEDCDGRVWRYGKDGILIGVTILDYQSTWRDKRDQLVKELAKRFSVSEGDAKYALQH